MLRFLLCQCNAETAGGGSLAVFLPHFRQILAQGGGIDAGGSDSLPSDLERACRDGIGIGFGHVVLDRVLNGFDFGVEIFGHLAKFGQFRKLADDFVGCQWVCLLLFGIACVILFTVKIILRNS